MTRKQFYKYTQEQIDKVIELKKQKVTNNEIVIQTGVNLNTVKTIVKQNNLMLTPEEMQNNAYQAKLAKNPNAMSNMRKANKDKRLVENTPLLSEIRELIRDNKGFDTTITLISKTIKTRHEELEFSCSKHGNFKKNYYKIKDNEERCHKCAIESRPRRLLVSTEQVRELAESRGYKLLAEYEGGNGVKIKLNCSKHGDWEPMYSNFKSGSNCPQCSAAGPSKGEQALADYVMSLGAIIEQNNRRIIKPKEIDIFIPDKNLAIEYNGLYWHSELQKNESDHFDKYHLLRDKNISLLAIFEDEWANKPDLIKGMIRHRLGIYNQKIRASDLEFKKLESNSTFYWFFDKFHIDGHTKASFAYGLFDKEKLVSCISFRKNMGSGMWEIARFATDYDYHIHGGFSKLLKNFTERPLLTYSNNRIGNGDVYKNNGFEEITDKNNGPGYFYTDFRERKFRTQFQKKHDPEILALHKTEREQALAGVLSSPFGHDLPIYRIYDYGHRKWVLK